MIKTVTVKYNIVQLKGGLDQITPTLNLPPGVVRDGVNFECSPSGGYSRVTGYERFDGHTSPSSAAYTLIQIDSFTNVPSVGNTITNQTGTPTAKVIVVTSQYIIVTKVTGTFSVGDTIKVGATVIGTYSTQTIMLTSLQDAQYINLAADDYRADIGPVPGSGSVLGVVPYNDIVYAFRANAGGTAVDIYKSSAAGWVNVPLYKEVSFTAGAVTVPADGATLTQGGVTATVKRVMTESGAWTGTAAGRFIITTPSGGNFAAGAATLSGGATVTLSGVQTSITLAVGGKFQFDQGNLTGSASTIRIYGCDGVNRCFEFDGDVLAPIKTGFSPDNPKHIVVHKNHLFVSKDSSILNSAIGKPYNFTIAEGASEIATGDIVTGFLVQPGSQATGALAVFGRSNTFVLYGTSSADWNFTAYATGTGAIDYTTQNMAQSYFLDDRGLMSLQTSLNYGNFVQATLTNAIRPFINSKRSIVAGSTLWREKSQYRLFFSDGTGLYTTVVNNTLLGSIPIQLKHTVYSISEGEFSTGEEVIFAGMTNGYVMQMEKGTSFDGENIDAYITLNWDAIGSPRLLKRFRRASAEITGNAYAAVNFGYQLAYASSEITQATPKDYAAPFQAAPAWDSFTWDNFIWDGKTLTPTEIEVEGTAENIQVTFTSTTDYIASYTINSLILHYSMRRGLR